METTNTTKVEKIVVQREDELIDLLRKLEKTKSDKVLFSFAEDSDLLVSPINLKVLVKTADEKGKVVINQIIHNVAGVNNSRIAGIITTDDTATITPELWETAEIEMRKRSRENSTKLRRVDTAPKNKGAEAEKDVEIIPAIQEESDQQKIEEAIEQEVATSTDNQDNAELTTELPLADKITQTRAKSMSSFEEKIEKALEKTKEERYQSSKDLVQQDDFIMAIDKDISDIMPSQTKKHNIQAEENLANDNAREKLKEESQAKAFVGKDFVPGTNFTPGFKPPVKLNQTLSPSAVLSPMTGRPKSMKPGDILKRFFASFGKQKSSRSLNRVIFGLIIVIAVVFFLMYSFLPNAKVKIYIESKPVSIEKVFTGEPGSVFDSTLSTISVKVENVSEQRSDSGTATGTGTRGKLAEGIIVVKCNSSAGATISIPAETVITSKGGKTYKLNAAVNLSCPGQTNATVKATAYGKDYNISSGDFFTIAGNNSADVFADNNAAFTGGDAVPYTMVSQSDYDTVVNRLKQIAYDDATKELKEIRATDGWAIIDATITNELDGEPEADYPVGSETDIFNVTLKSKSKATYYRKSEIDKATAELLAAEAKRLDLFSGVDNLDTKSLQEVQTSITVEKVDGNKVTVKLSANAIVKPAVNKEDITKNLAGKSWSDGINYLGTLKFGSKPIEVEYEPQSFPRFLWAFPEKNRITINVVETKVEVPLTDQTTTPETPETTQ